MEFLLFRMLRLIDREIQLYENLYQCLSRQHDNILEGKILDLMVDMFEQNETITMIADVEADIKEDTVELCSQMQIFSKQPNLTVVVEALKDRYPKMCDFFRARGKKLEKCLTKVEGLNTENIVLLQNYKNVWQNVIPLYTAWNEFDDFVAEQQENQHVEEPLYEINLN